MQTSAAKIKTIKELIKIVGKAKSEGKIIVTTNGCFDILHVGHTNYLENAKNMGDILIVGLNSDKSVKRNKGDKRPIVGEKERAKVIAALTAVDYVFIFNEETPKPWLLKIKPHIHVKGGDYGYGQNLIEKKLVEKYGGRMALAPHVKNRSTTKLIKKIKNL
ncbi:MAG: D-glycero-beta-D-manno-heptose 1-phosphate adenylyltransferase [Patescibacteria group bacterium]|nr:D-glycero-beta-D-manno-heptose 1-phosphate adenylyltransferase [Patescibacteria group bacterium]MDE2015248.1 D-glycero-beta-D-manno-heptose 1-phosphate adenylyltransferase [Patescibacteria group bacterium]MDE2227054.1 D-glycero-beta-D-manno-heptose 1-phosphate adenylyltransferase [Patescibacteria group bacterium]